MCLSLPVLRIASLAMICPSVNGSVSENRRGKRSGGFGKDIAKCRVCFVSGAAGILSYRIIYLDRFIMLESLLLRGSSVGHGDYGGSLLYMIKSGATTRGLSTPEGKPRLRDICIHPCMGVYDGAGIRTVTFWGRLQQACCRPLYWIPLYGSGRGLRMKSACPTNQRLCAHCGCSWRGTSSWYEWPNRHQH